MDRWVVACLDERIHSVEWDGYDSQDSAERATGGIPGSSS